MARNQTPLVNWSQYLALRGVAGLMNCFDVNQNLATAGWIGSLWYRIFKRHRDRAHHNLAESFPHWTEEQVAHVAVQSLRNMFKIGLVDAFFMPRLVTRTSWPRYLEIGEMSQALRRMVKGEPTIFVTGHCGNWELLGYSLAVLDYPLYALARPLDNPLINDWLLGIRERQGMRILTKWGATPVLQTLLKTGGRVAFIADQNAGDGGLFVPFFGRLASTYKSIGLLAMRYEVPIIVGIARRVGGRFEYELSAPEVIRPEDWVDQPDPLYYVTARFSRALEKLIRVSPEQYIWHHRRWKSRPAHERRGKPMPARLRAKLEALPWMTASELERIVEHSNESARRIALQDPQTAPA